MSGTEGQLSGTQNCTQYQGLFKGPIVLELISPQKWESLRGAGTRGFTIFSQKCISVYNSFMLAPIDLVMVSKESSFNELSNGIHFNLWSMLASKGTEKSNSDKVY